MYGMAGRLQIASGFLTSARVQTHRKPWTGGVEMATIYKEILLDADPGKVWDAVRDVAQVHKRLVPGLLVDTRMVGNERVVRFANGLVVRELIVTVDDETRRLVYASVAGRATHHNASFQVFSEGEDRTRLVWITDVLPDDLAVPIGETAKQVAAAIKRTLESSLP
jgi:carbon monoxide dehydrogenase subunit G